MKFQHRAKCSVFEQLWINNLIANMHMKKPYPFGPKFKTENEYYVGFSIKSSVQSESCIFPISKTQIGTNRCNLYRNPGTSHESWINPSGV